MISWQARANAAASPCSTPTSKFFTGSGPDVGLQPPHAIGLVACSPIAEEVH